MESADAAAMALKAHLYEARIYSRLFCRTGSFVLYLCSSLGTKVLSTFLLSRLVLVADAADGRCFSVPIAGLSRATLRMVDKVDFLQGLRNAI